MKCTVYIETTIPSFYYEVRDDPEMIARRESTRRWWTNERQNYELVTSAYVIGELRRGEYPGRDDALSLIQHLPLLELTPAIEEIAKSYVDRHLMPTGEMGDAYHLAAASCHGCDFLLTWNCRHLANANKARHLAGVNIELGLPIPIITTPDLLLTETYDAPG